MASILIIAGITIATILAVWQDFKWHQRILRVVLIVASGILLLGFWISPNLIQKSISANYALLTEGYKESDFDDSLYEKVFTLEDKGVGVEKSLSRKWLSSPVLLSEHIAEGSTVDVWGKGTLEDLPGSFNWNDQLSLNSKSLILNEAPHQIERGKEFSISMTVHGSNADDSLFIFKDGSTFSEIKIDSSGQILFTDRLNALGPAHYTFEWFDGDSVISEEWNIRGIQPQRLHIAILLYSPSFEITHFVEHFGDREHTIIQRTRLGENQFRYDALQAETSAAENIFAQLSETDLLILDAREYLQISNSEQQTIERAVENGLDILLLPPSVDETSEWIEAFTDLSDQTIQVEEINRLEERNWLPGESTSELNQIPLLNLSFQNLPASTDTLHSYIDNSPIAIKMLSGNGSISSHLFYQSYSWILSGNEHRYNNFWSQYLSEIISLESSQIYLAPAIPRVDYSTKIITTGSNASDSLVVTSLNDNRAYALPVVTAKDHPQVVYADFWPLINGWHRVQFGNLNHWFYVYGDGDWQTDLSYQKSLHTKKQIEHNSLNSSEFNQKYPLPDWIWIISFLTLQVILWIERKLPTRKAAR